MEKAPLEIPGTLTIDETGIEVPITFEVWIDPGDPSVGWTWGIDDYRIRLGGRNGKPVEIASAIKVEDEIRLREWLWEKAKDYLDEGPDVG